MEKFIFDNTRCCCKQKKESSSQTNVYIILTIVIGFLILILIVIFFVVIPFNNLKKKVDDLIVPAKNLIDKTNATEDRINSVVTKAENIENILIKVYPAIKSFVCPIYPSLPICK